MTLASTPGTLDYVRSNVRNLINEFDAADGLAGYYTLYHDDKRTAVWMRRNADDMIDGFLARCQTGIDLFRPVVVMRLRGRNAIPYLLEDGLIAGRPYIMIIPSDLEQAVKPYLTIQARSENSIFRLDPTRFQSEINVRVTHRVIDFNPRTEVSDGKQVVAWAGVNWRSPLFAEVFVSVESGHEGRGLGRIVTTAICTDLLKLGVTPIYNVPVDHRASVRLAESVGFVDTGARELTAQVVRG